VANQRRKIREDPWLGASTEPQRRILVVLNHSSIGRQMSDWRPVAGSINP
jgi:hypothetical protein